MGTGHGKDGSRGRSGTEGVSTERLPAPEPTFEKAPIHPPDRLAEIAARTRFMWRESMRLRQRVLERGRLLAARGRRRYSAGFGVVLQSLIYSVADRSTKRTQLVARLFDGREA